MLHAEWTPRDWYLEASRRYVEGHQACAWCGGAHRVRKTEHNDRLEFQCNSCDFHASFDPKTGRYAFVPGEKRSPSGTLTMHDL